MGPGKAEITGNREEWQLIIDNDTKKDYLRQYQKKKLAVRDIELDIESTREEKMSASAGMGDGMPHGNEKTDLSNYIVALEEKEQMLIKARYHRVKCCTCIYNNIEKLENEDEKRILYLRYIKGLRWEEICIEAGYEWTWVHTLHRRALEHLEIVKPK